MPARDAQPPTTDHPAAPTVRRRAALLVWKALAVLLRSLLLLAIGVAAFSPRLIGYDWRFDLVATLLAQVALGAFVLAVWQGAFRRWVWCALFTVGGAACFSWMLTVERAAYDSGTPDVDRTMLRVLEMNVYSKNTRTDELLGVIGESEADIVVILETSIALLEAIPTRADLLARYPYHSGLEERSPGQILVLSSLPLQEQISGGSTGRLNRRWGFRAGFVSIDGVPVRFAALHAPSPRTEATWKFGQNTFDRLGTDYERLGSPLTDGGLPTILVGDLNCSPTSVRSRRITEELGLARAKPLRRWDGTFPSKAPWFARSAIDGAMVSGGVIVHRWETVTLPGSDHRGVLMELSISGTGTD